MVENMHLEIKESMRGNFDQGVCPVCSTEEGWSNVLKCEENGRWRDELTDK
jgi:hypothetical protein